MIRKIKTATLPSGEHLTYWRSDGGTCSVDVTFDKDISSTSGSFDDVLLTLAARFRTLAIMLENLAAEGKGKNP